jgi:citrate lyase subunit beta/citryl-CoA lyase
MKGIRSLLFVPGDSARKFERARLSGADALILDLEDSVADDVKPAARLEVARMLEARGEGQAMFVRVNAFDTGMTLLDLHAVVGRADGIVLPKCGGAEDVLKLSHQLDAFEVAAGAAERRTSILAIVTENARSLFALGGYRGCDDRLTALIWGAEDLAADVGAFEKRNSSGYHGPFRLARDLALMAAAGAGIAAIDTVYTDIPDLEGLSAEARAARRDGFQAKMAIHPSHIPVINEAFGASASELTWARQIVEAFDADPRAGALKIEGRMIDRPHLALARKLLERAGAGPDAATLNRGG